MRKEIGIRTVFNLLGPLTNPARVEHLVLGVPTEELGNKIAAVLHRLGTKRSLVVHGLDGLDEISISGKSLVWDVSEGILSPPYEVSPETFGFKEADRSEIAGGSALENAALLLHILGGEKGAPRDIVIINTAAALIAGNITTDPKEAAKLAAAAIDSGRAREKLDRLGALRPRLGG